MAESDEIPGLDIEIHPLTGDPRYIKCPRCWRYHACRMNYDGLCDRCCQVLVAHHPDHPAVPLIRASFRAQRDRWAAHAS